MLNACSIRRMIAGLREERASNVVEFALSASILLTLIVGTMILCMALYSFHYISDAAREGARYASVRGAKCSSYGKFSSACPAASSDVQTYIRGLGFPIISSSNLTATTKWSTDYTTWSTSSTSKNSPGDYVQVQVTYTAPFTIPWVSTRTLTLHSTSIAVITD